jgi:hypothetical protein
MHLTFDARGHIAAFAFFAAIALSLAVAFLIHVRKRRDIGPLTIGALLTFAVLAVAVLHGWLFWSTYFDLRVDRGAGTVQLVLRLPERHVVRPLREVTSIHRVPGNKGTYHLVVDFQDGLRYESPQLSYSEVERALEVVRPLALDVLRPLGNER